MLRHKLLLLLGSLLAMLLVASFTAILLLNGLFDHLSEVAAAGLDRSVRTAALGTTLTSIETEINEMHLQEDVRLDALLDSVDTLNRQCERLGAGDGPHAPAVPEYRRLQTLVSQFTGTVADLATMSDPELTAGQTDVALKTSLALREAIADVNRALQVQTEEEHVRIGQRFRMTVLGLGLAFLIVINLTILVLFKAASIIIRPVDELVEATRHLARADFDYRVDIRQHDEFRELGDSLNHLAEELASTEQRRIETLHQVATSLNHELNNAISTIELQLELVARTPGGNPDQEERFSQIQQVLRRMTGIVESLKRIRRIVLTDYVGGVKMLDLERSVEDDPAEGSAATAPMVRTSRV